MPLDSPVDDFMAGFTESEDRPALRMVDADDPAESDHQWAVIESGLTNEDRRQRDRQLQQLGWKRVVFRIHDETTGEETGKQVYYTHESWPNPHNRAGGWTQATAYLHAGLATGRVKVGTDGG